MSNEPAKLPYESIAGKPQPGCATVFAALCIGFGLFVLLYTGLFELMMISQRTRPAWAAQQSIYLWSQLDPLITLALATGSIVGGLLFMRRRHAGRLVLLAYSGIGIAWTITACVLNMHFISVMRQLQIAMGQQSSNRSWGLLIPTAIVVIWRLLVLIVMLDAECAEAPAAQSPRCESRAVN